MGFVVPDGGRWRVLPSEGGHGNLAPSDPLEARSARVPDAALRLRRLGNRAVRTGARQSVSSGVRGVGLQRRKSTNPAEITARALTVADPVCHQTLEMFCNLLGTAAGALAVTVCATGGVYLAGGILPRLGDFLDHESVSASLRSARTDVDDYVKAIPTRSACCEPELGLMAPPPRIADGAPEPAQRGALSRARVAQVVSSTSRYR